jgi:hypothetical protein
MHIAKLLLLTPLVSNSNSDAILSPALLAKIDTINVFSFVVDECYADPDAMKKDRLADFAGFAGFAAEFPKKWRECAGINRELLQEVEKIGLGEWKSEL